MSLYNPISFFFVLTMCALIAEQLGQIGKGNITLVFLVFAVELCAFYYLYRIFTKRTDQPTAYYKVIFSAFVCASLASLFLMGMVSPISAITTLINLLMT